MPVMQSIQLVLLFFMLLRTLASLLQFIHSVCACASRGIGHNVSPITLAGRTAEGHCHCSNNECVCLCSWTDGMARNGVHREKKRKPRTPPLA